MNLRNPLANAHNHGSAGDGVGHWWAQRLSAIMMVFLTVWLIVALFSLVGSGHAEAVAWLSHPFHAAMAILFMVVGIYHGQLGLQVIIEDYIRQRALGVLMQVAVKILSIVGGLLAVLAVLKIALGV